MWFGRTWKHVMPEVFNNNPRPRQKMTTEDILDIRTKYRQGMLEKDIEEIYKEKYSHAAISDIINNKRFTDIQPDTPDCHQKGGQKLTVDKIKLIKELKNKGYKHKEIREALNNKVSMTTISDIVNEKRYSDIK